MLVGATKPSEREGDRERENPFLHRKEVVALQLVLASLQRERERKQERERERESILVQTFIC